MKRGKVFTFSGATTWDLELEPNSTPNRALLENRSALRMKIANSGTFSIERIFLNSSNRNLSVLENEKPNPLNSEGNGGIYSGNLG